MQGWKKGASVVSTQDAALKDKGVRVASTYENHTLPM